MLFFHYLGFLSFFIQSPLNFWKLDFTVFLVFSLNVLSSPFDLLICLGQANVGFAFSLELDED